jgi:acyl carrier protein
MSHNVDLGKEIKDILVRSAGLSPKFLGIETRDATLKELGLDSLASMELQAVVKDRYGVRIPDDSLEMSVPQIVEYVDSELGQVG